MPEEHHENDGGIVVTLLRAIIFMPFFLVG